MMEAYIAAHWIPTVAEKLLVFEMVPVAVVAKISVFVLAVVGEVAVFVAVEIPVLRLELALQSEVRSVAMLEEEVVVVGVLEVVL
jgi:hypothetical protein